MRHVDLTVATLPNMNKIRVDEKRSLCFIPKNVPLSTLWDIISVESTTN
jgi:hypothetical protein